MRAAWCGTGERFGALTALQEVSRGRGNRPPAVSHCVRHFAGPQGNISAELAATKDSEGGGPHSPQGESFTRISVNRISRANRGLALGRTSKALLRQLSVSLTHLNVILVSSRRSVMLVTNGGEII
jgi:hypothetical protein